MTISLSEAAAEVQAAQRELRDSKLLIDRLDMEKYHAERRHDLAEIRHEEAHRVLLEVASQ